MPITHFAGTGQNLYVLFDDSSTSPTAVDLTEGSDYYAGRYYVSDTDIASAGLSEGKYSYTVRLGTAATKAATDSSAGGGSYQFDGAYEVTGDGVLASLVAASTNDDEPQLDPHQFQPTVNIYSGAYNGCDCVITTNGVSELHQIVSNTTSLVSLAADPSVPMVIGTTVKVLASKTLSSIGTITSKLPADDRNMAGAGDTSTNLDNISVTATTDVTSINSVAVSGSGTSEDPWKGVP